MKLAVSSATSTAVFLASASACTLIFAETTDTPAPNDNSLSLKLRNYYQDRQLKDFSQHYLEPGGARVKTHNKQQAWGQGAEINFQSAWLGTKTAGIGLDFSLYGGLKLLGENNYYGTTILKEETPAFHAGKGEYLANQSSYGKIGQVYAKGIIGDDNYNLQAKAGWIPIEKPLLHTYYRLTPTTFQGAMAEAALGNLDLYGAWANRVSLYNHESMEDFTSLRKGSGGREKRHEKINYLYTLGGSYSHESGLGSDLAYAESESYLKLYHANLNYTFLLNEYTSLLLEGQYYKGEENGEKWKSQNETFGGFDKDANLYNLNAKLTFDMLSLMASYSQVEAEKQGTLGEFDFHLAYDAGRDYDDLGYLTKRQISSFNHNGEKVWQAGVQYAFDNLGMPGLTLGYTFTQGNDIKATNHPSYNDKYKEREHNIEFGYAFQQRTLKGLSFKVLYAQHQADKELSKIKNEDSKKDFEHKGMTDLRVFVDYTLSAF